MTDEVLRHFSAHEEILGDTKNCGGVDFLIGKVEDAAILTANMAGFGMEKNQKIIIDFDKDYDYFLVRKMTKEYGKQR